MGESIVLIGGLTSQENVVGEMFQEAYRAELAVQTSPSLEKSLPKSLAYFINKRMIVDGLDPSVHQGAKMKCACCDVYIWRDPFERKFGLLLPSHPGPAWTSLPLSYIPVSLIRWRFA